MENEDKPTTSRVSLNINSNNNEAAYKNLSAEELNEKINVFRNLCMGNKINVSNAFDIDIIECFSIWLEKKKKTNNDDNISSFQEIADYLEATGKVYGFRVDNVTESTSRLIEQFRAMNHKANKLENQANPDAKVQKPKRSKLMLTTADKLRRKPTEIGKPQYLYQGLPNLDYNQMLSSGQPSKYLMSLFHETTLEEEMKQMCEKKDVDNNETYTLDDMDDIDLDKPICPQFHGYVAERDRKNIDSNNSEINLEGIEYRFDPNNHKFQSLIASNDMEIDNETSSSNKKESELSGLIQCVDTVNRDYSFFNPKLLANWNGPKAWKAQAMLNALKSCNPTERKAIMSSSNFLDGIDKETQKIVQPKVNRKRTKANTVFKVKWMEMDKIKHVMNKRVQSKEKLLPRVVQKWHAVDNICDTKSIVIDMNLKSDFLKYLDIQPDWWTQQQNQIISATEHASGHSSTNQKISEVDKTVLDTFDHCVDMFDETNTINTKNPECIVEFHSNDEIIIKQFKTETNANIGDLKQEISKIIDQECAIFDSKSEWSTCLSFSNLLLKLKANEKKLMVPMVFVALLHLTNERGLKLFKNTNFDDEDFNIVKPIIRT